MSVSFKLLWDKYPEKRMPCDGPWDNQCAIRMSIALIDSGFKLDNYTDPKCSHGHARGAESLANYLWNALFAPLKVYAQPAVKGKQGIIFFKDIATFRGGEGDHIDLWDKTDVRTGVPYFGSCTEVWFWSL